MPIKTDKAVVMQVDPRLVGPRANETSEDAAEEFSNAMQNKAAVIQISMTDERGNPEMVDLPLSAYGDFRNLPTPDGSEKSSEQVYFNIVDSSIDSTDSADSRKTIARDSWKAIFYV